MRTNPREEHANKTYKVYIASGALQFIVMDILSLLPKTTNDNQLVVIMTNRYYKFTRAVPILKTNVTNMVSIF